MGGCAGFRASGHGLEEASGLEIQCSLQVEGLGFRIHEGFSVWGLGGLSIWGLGFKVLNPSCGLQGSQSFRLLRQHVWRPEPLVWGGRAWGFRALGFRALRFRAQGFRASG